MAASDEGRRTTGAETVLRGLRRIRLIPLVVIATASLFVLKSIAILAGDHSLLLWQEPPRKPVSDQAPAVLPQTSGETRLAKGAGSASSRVEDLLGLSDVTGSIGGAAPPAAAAAAKPTHPAATPGPGGSVQPSSPEDKSGPPPGERAVLERLQERRQELEARARELELREGLIKAAEKRLETRLDELKRLEVAIGTATQKKDEAEAARFKSLITMYENMKAKDAARIFDRLELRVLLDVAGQINPRRMSDILGQMSSEAAERLTVELAARAAATGKPGDPRDLPKIEGRPRP